MRDGDFRIRGKDISRVEGLSDAVFGFAITLLVVSLEVPKTSDEVLHAMRGFFAFAVTFSILFMVWRTQFTFFRRYGLEDNPTVFLNAVLLFVILFFVYPLKFVIGAIVERLLFHAGFPDPAAANILKDQHAPLLMIIYASGFAAVFGVFALMYRHAYNKRHELQLSEIELFDTQQMFMACVGSSVIGFLAGVSNAPAYFMRKGDAADTTSIVLTVAILATVAMFLRRRLRSRKERKQLLATIRSTAVEA